jgi:hypothetical protein
VEPLADVNATVTTCALARASWIGERCSCRVPGYRALGTVASSYGYAPSASANPFEGLAGTITAPVTMAAEVPAAAAGAATAPLYMGRRRRNWSGSNGKLLLDTSEDVRAPSRLLDRQRLLLPGARRAGTGLSDTVACRSTDAGYADGLVGP